MPSLVVCGTQQIVMLRKCDHPPREDGVYELLFHAERAGCHVSLDVIQDPKTMFVEQDRALQTDGDFVVHGDFVAHGAQWVVKRLAGHRNRREGKGCFGYAFIYTAGISYLGQSSIPTLF
jgi:hypothetical protein